MSQDEEKRTVKKEVEFNLSVVDYKKKCKETVVILDEIDELRIERKALSIARLKRVKKKKQELSLIRKIIKSGKELRKVKLTEVKYFKEGKVRYFYRDRCIEERKISDKERQIKMVGIV